MLDTLSSSNLIFSQDPHKERDSYRDQDPESTTGGRSWIRPKPEWPSNTQHQTRLANGARLRYPSTPALRMNPSSACLGNIMGCRSNSKETYCDTVSWADGAQKTPCNGDSEARLRARPNPQMKSTLSIVGHAQDTTVSLLCSRCNMDWQVHQQQQVAMNHI